MYIFCLLYESVTKTRNRKHRQSPIRCKTGSMHISTPTLFGAEKARRKGGKKGQEWGMETMGIGMGGYAMIERREGRGR